MNAMSQTQQTDTGPEDGLSVAGRRVAEAQDAVWRFNWAEAEKALDLAARAYDELDDGNIDDETWAKLDEGRAKCALIRSDIALRKWNLEEAEAQLDSAYQLLKQGEGIGVELWRLTARLAERRGRWSSAWAAWKRVTSSLEGKDEMGYADAWIRIGEVGLIEGKAKRVDKAIEVIESLARELESPLLNARLSLLHAGSFEHQHAYDAAIDAYRDAEREAEDAPSDFRGLLDLRMAGALARRTPKKATKRLERAHAELIESGNPDADGLVLSQIAVLALILGQPQLAALAAIAAEASRGGNDGTSRPLIAGALEACGHKDLAAKIPELETQVVEHDAVEAALTDTLGELDLNWSHLGEPRSVAPLLTALGGIQAGTLQIRVEDAEVVTDIDALFRQRASLTWDAPQGRLEARKPPPPTLTLAAKPTFIVTTAPSPPTRKPRISHSNPPVGVPPMTQVTGYGISLVGFVALAFVVGLVLAVVLRWSLGYFFG